MICDPIIHLFICCLAHQALTGWDAQMGRKHKGKEEHKQESEEEKRGKTIKRHKGKKRRRDAREGQVKEEEQKAVRKSKKRQAKRGKCEEQVNKQQDPQVKEELSVEQTVEQVKKSKKKQRKKLASSPQNKSQDQQMAIDIESIKVEDDFPSQPARPSLKKEGVSFEDSERIIYIFSLDAGDYKGLRAELPHIPQKSIRNHLTRLFEYCLQVVTERVKSSGRKIKEWECQERREIIRELHRIRSSNRLLSEANVEFRQTFHKMMRTYNHPDLLMTELEVTFLFRKIEAFVRGFNQLHVFRKNQYVPPDQEDETRKPIFEGGYIMEQRARSEAKIDPSRLVLEWTQEEEVEICKLYLVNPNYQFIIQNLRAKFGESGKWKDFEIVGKKLDHVIKAGLCRLEELTAKPYNRSERMQEEQRKAKWKEEERKRLKMERMEKHRLQDCPQLREGRLIKNPYLLLKQVFAHSGESYKVKYALIHLLVERYPQEEELQATLQIIKDFSEWATREEEVNHVTMVRARLPVIDDGTKSKSAKDNEVAQEDVDVALGLNLLEDLQESPSEDKEEQGKSRKEEAQRGRVVLDVDEVKKEEVIEVFESGESDYEGFVSTCAKLAE